MEKLVTELDLELIYKSTQKHYGKEGQESIDPAVFFKILLAGYLNNICSVDMQTKLLSI